MLDFFTVFKKLISDGKMGLFDTHFAKNAFLVPSKKMFESNLRAQSWKFDPLDRTESKVHVERE